MQKEIEGFPIILLRGTLVLLNRLLCVCDAKSKKCLKVRGCVQNNNVHFIQYMKFQCPSCHVNIPDLSRNSALEGGSTLLGVISIPAHTDSCPRCKTKLKCQAHPLHKFALLFLTSSLLTFLGGIIIQTLWLSFVGVLLFAITGYIFVYNSSYKEWNYYHFRK